MISPKKGGGLGTWFKIKRDAISPPRNKIKRDMISPPKNLKSLEKEKVSISLPQIVNAAASPKQGNQKQVLKKNL